MSPEQMTSFTQVLQFLYPTIMLACGIVMFIRFRPSVGVIIGGCGFLIVAGCGISRLILFNMEQPPANLREVFLFVHATETFGEALTLVGLITAYSRRGPVAGTASDANLVPRPVGVSIISWVIIAFGIIGTGALVWVFFQVQSSDYVRMTKHGPLLFTIGVLAALFRIALGAMMLNRQNWARITYTLIVPVTLIATLALNKKLSEGNVIGLLIFVVTVVFLWLPKANAYFGRRSVAPESAPPAVPPIE